MALPMMPTQQWDIVRQMTAEELNRAAQGAYLSQGVSPVFALARIEEEKGLKAAFQAEEQKRQQAEQAKMQGVPPEEAPLPILEQRLRERGVQPDPMAQGIPGADPTAGQGPSPEQMQQLQGGIAEALPPEMAMQEQPMMAAGGGLIPRYDEGGLIHDHDAIPHPHDLEQGDLGSLPPRVVPEPVPPVEFVDPFAQFDEMPGTEHSEAPAPDVPEVPEVPEGDPRVSPYAHLNPALLSDIDDRIGELEELNPGVPIQQERQGERTDWEIAPRGSPWMTQHQITLMEDNPEYGALNRQRELVLRVQDEGGDAVAASIRDELAGVKDEAYRTDAGGTRVAPMTHDELMQIPEYAGLYRDLGFVENQETPNAEIPAIVSPYVHTDTTGTTTTDPTQTELTAEEAGRYGVGVGPPQETGCLSTTGFDPMPSMHQSIVDRIEQAAFDLAEYNPQEIRADIYERNIEDKAIADLEELETERQDLRAIDETYIAERDAVRRGERRQGEIRQQGIEALLERNETEANEQKDELRALNARRIAEGEETTAQREDWLARQQAQAGTQADELRALGDSSALATLFTGVGDQLRGNPREARFGGVAADVAGIRSDTLTKVHDIQNQVAQDEARVIEGIYGVKEGVLSGEQDMLTTITELQNNTLDRTATGQAQIYEITERLLASDRLDAATDRDMRTALKEGDIEALRQLQAAHLNKEKILLSQMNARIQDIEDADTQYIDQYSRIYGPAAQAWGVKGAAQQQALANVRSTRENLLARPEMVQHLEAAEREEISALTNDPIWNSLTNAQQIERRQAVEAHYQAMRVAARNYWLRLAGQLTMQEDPLTVSESVDQVISLSGGEGFRTGGSQEALVEDAQAIVADQLERLEGRNALEQARRLEAERAAPAGDLTPALPPPPPDRGSG